jgi:uncharacterized protein YecE (DUF72 family)
MLFVGTSGWQYRHWKLTFYPKEVRQRDWLRYFSERFRTVELNNSFYRLPEASSFVRWREETPDDFVVAAKMSRFRCRSSWRGRAGWAPSWGRCWCSCRLA